jgi:hypothetical protein
MPIITISEEMTTGSKTPDWALEIFEETVRLDELIRRWIFQEVAESGTHADPEERTRVTLGAFGRNAFVVLVDDRQVAELDEEVHLRAGTRVTFLKLVPLVGG